MFALINHPANRYNSLNLQLAIEHDGYAVVYLANESMMDVFFDDLSVKHERLVWQENSYYPFGMAIKPLDKEGYPEHRWKYNGMTERNEVIGWDETDFRSYDYQLGRFHQIDPKSEKFLSWSGYHYAYNNPITYLDPDGQENVIYLYSQKDKNGNAHMDKKQMRELKKKVNTLLKSHGLKTRAKISKSMLNGGDLDKTDTFVSIGTQDQAVQINNDETNGFDRIPEGALTSSTNPEGASNPELDGKYGAEGTAGNIIHVIPSKVNAWLEQSNSQSRPAYDGVTPLDFMAGLVFHGAGHNAGLPHSDIQRPAGATDQEEKDYRAKYPGLVFGFGMKDRYTFMGGASSLSENRSTFKQNMNRMNSAQKAKWQAKFGNKRAKSNLRRKSKKG